MQNATYEHICNLIKDLTKKSVDANSMLFSSDIGLEPRDVLYIIAKFIDLNHIEVHIMPIWSYNEVNVETLSCYCDKIKLCNSISIVEKTSHLETVQ